MGMQGFLTAATGSIELSSKRADPAPIRRLAQTGFAKTRVEKREER
jgi:hypothetical protein